MEVELEESPTAAVVEQGGGAPRVVTASRLPYVIICTVGVVMLVVGVAVTTYKLQAGSNILSFFNKSFVTLLSNTSNTGSNESTAPKHLLKHERRTVDSESTCKSDVCGWLEGYLRSKFNASVNPCHDFYGYVCSRHWFANDLDIQHRLYIDRTAGMLMMDIEKFFRDYLKQNEERYHKYPGVFLHQAISLLPKCQSEEKNDKNMTSLKALLEEYNLGSWPYRKAPRGVSIVTVSAFVDRDLAVFPFAKVTLRKPFEDDRGYTVHLDKPSLTLKRHQLAFLDESVENYTRKVALALSFLDKQEEEQAEAIVQLEKKLLSAMPVTRFVEFQDRIKRIGQLERKGKWDWKEYLTILFQDIEVFDSDKPVAVLNQEYLNKMAAILNETETVTLLNYVGYRLVVQVSPLLAKAANPLLRLSHDDYREFVPDRLQACMHLLERVYKHGVRFFARMTFSKNNATLLLKHYDHSMSNIETQLKGTMADRLLSTSSWLDRSAIGIGVDKIENIRFVFLGSTDDINSIANYYNFNAQPLDGSHLLESFREIHAGTRNIYWETKPPKDDLDARYEHSALSPGFEYMFGRNVLFIPHGNIAFLNDISKTIEPLLYPLLLPNVLRGMFAAVDRRGATVDHNLAVATWWNTDELSKFSQMELCFQDQYYIEIRDLVGDNFDARIRLDENIADNAIVAPLHDVYYKAVTSQGVSLEKQRLSVDVGDLDLQKLFFVLYALGLCDNPLREAAVRRIRYEEMPGRLRVNIPLMNFPKFSSAFNCPVGSPMNPARKCSVW
ncbi:neprilysin-21-like [Ornithodoros turicata]|uniref:neprilysin-21-like n=1 Tax=Ornithodoros turicata TaxID=34597 RepID=UPI0031398419